MNFSMNIHPKGEWTSVKAEMWGEGDGTCIFFTATDSEGATTTVIFHLKSWKNRNKVLALFKEAINSIPEFCDTCGHVVEKDHK